MMELVTCRQLRSFATPKINFARQRICRVAASQHQHPNGRPIELPGGGYWWMGRRSNDSLFYGGAEGASFVLHRPPPPGSEGLVPAQKPGAMQRYIAARSCPPAVRPRQPLGLSTSLSSGVIVIDTEAEEIIAQPCTGIVYVGSGDDTTADVLPSRRGRGRHPRRTRVLRFQCNLCDEVNVKEINPHAWRKGSVFCRCDGCSAVHKLKDNLKIFHELKGAVFPPRDMRASFPAVAEILERIEAKRRQERGE